MVELNGTPVNPTISDGEFVEQLKGLPRLFGGGMITFLTDALNLKCSQHRGIRPVVLGFTRPGEDAATEATKVVAG